MPRSKYSLKQPAMTTYSYNGLYGLNAERLFMWIVIDTTKEQLGIDNIVGAIAIISGQPVISTRGSPRALPKGRQSHLWLLGELLTFSYLFVFRCLPENRYSLFVLL